MEMEENNRSRDHSTTHIRAPQRRNAAPLHVPSTSAPQHKRCIDNLRLLLPWQHHREPQQEVSASTTNIQIPKENAEDGDPGTPDSD